MTRTLRPILLCAAAAALLSATDAAAQTTVSSTFAVTASVAANCRIDAAADIAITTAGSPWDPTSAATPTQTGTITVRCTRGTQYTIDLNGGSYSDVMTHTNGTDTLPYKLLAADCTSDFTPVTVTAANRAPRDQTICAGIDVANALTDPIAGDYADTVTVDVTF